MNFHLTINCENAAFGDGNAGNEVARILRHLADRVENSDLAGGDEFRLMDFNGNRVGLAGAAD